MTFCTFYQKLSKKFENLTLWIQKQKDCEIATFTLMHSKELGGSGLQHSKPTMKTNKPGTAQVGATRKTQLIHVRLLCF